jgi:hypothetical protein
MFVTSALQSGWRATRGFTRHLGSHFVLNHRVDKVLPGSQTDAEYIFEVCSNRALGDLAHVRVAQQILYGSLQLEIAWAIACKHVGRHIQVVCYRPGHGRLCVRSTAYRSSAATRPRVMDVRRHVHPALRRRRRVGTRHWRFVERFASIYRLRLSIPGNIFLGRWHPRSDRVV